MSLFGQTTQTAQYSVALAGLCAGAPDQFDINAQCVVETNPIEFGTFASRNTAADKAHPPTTANDVLLYGLGFAKRDASHGFGALNSGDPSVDDYAVGQAIPVVKKGPGMWVKVAAGITPAFGDSVYVRYGATDRGMVSNAAGSAGTAGQILPACRFEDVSKVATLGIALISMNNAAAVGPTGPTGPTGATGPTGPTGA